MALIPADNEEVNFLCEITYLKILKAKDQLQASHTSRDSPFQSYF